MELAARKLPKRTQPRIAAFIGEESVTQYVIFCEQKVMCKVASFQLALLTMFASYYIFNLEYPAVVKNVLCFFQDYVLDYPDSNKRSGSYLATVSDIKRFM